MRTERIVELKETKTTGKNFSHSKKTHLKIFFKKMS